VYPSPMQLRAARTLVGLTQDEISRRVGLSQRTMVAVEMRKSSLSALHSVMGFYAGLGISFSGTPDYTVQTVTYTQATPPDVPPIPAT
jgi:hypothetical protein